MVPALRVLNLVLCVVAFAAPVCAQEIANWPAPATWSPARSHGGLTTMGEITSPLPFIGVAPCRIVDTRNAVGPFGGPAFTSGDTRSFTIPSGPCSGIPSSAGAYSLNFTVVNMIGFGFLTAWPAGTARPLVSTLDYVPAEGALANAAIVPAGSGGAISVYVSVGTDLIIDTNGYYGSPSADPTNVFLGPFAGNTTMTGNHNTGIGAGALAFNTDGFNNTAIGAGALESNTIGDGNTAIGQLALISNSGDSNTAVGDGALAINTDGFNNTAIGKNALTSNTTGQGNIGIGHNGGANLTTGFNNICIGSPGVAGESGTIRVGFSQTKTFVVGVNGVMTGGTGIPVVIDSNGQLGTVSSSARFKDEIQDMGDATEGLLKLRPVTFRFKAQPEGRTQFGLIAEEVEKVMPELVVCSSSGEVETVLYHEMPAMLLNELQKQQREIQELKSELSILRAVIGQKQKGERNRRPGDSRGNKASRRRS